MKPIENILPLPPLRKKIFKHTMMIVAVYVIVGIFMTAAVFFASGITPRVIHLNYDSISSAEKMDRAWAALMHPEDHPESKVENWAEQFERAIGFEELNVTERGEYAIALKIRNLWEEAKKAKLKLDPKTYHQMMGYLDELIEINERGMFTLASESSSISHYVFLSSVILFFIALFLTLYLADGLAVRIARPLKEMAATLRRKPLPGTKLKLPIPTSLEMRILEHEMSQLWERLGKLRKLNLEEIFTQKNKLETVLASVEDAILVLDTNSTVIHCNEGFLNLLSLKSENVIQQKWYDLSTVNENYFKLKELLNPAISSENTVELLVPQKASTPVRTRTFSGRCRNFNDKCGTPLGTLYLLHDITEIRQKDRLKTEFIGVLSHELKTPLQSLGTATELLHNRKDHFNEEEQMLIETAHEDVERIRAVANEFVQVGLIDLHTLRLKIQRVPLNQLLPQWIQPFQVIAKDRGVKVIYQTEGSEEIFAKIDTVKFPWAVSNLLSNALRVSSAGSTVTIALSDREKRADIEVRDEGPGIPEEVQKRMFEAYFQGPSGASISSEIIGQRGSGTERAAGFLGLGLTITKEVVDAHEGKIEYFEGAPRGSIFRISLPLMT